MRKALAAIGLVAALAACAPIVAEAGGKMGMSWQPRPGHSSPPHHSNRYWYPYYYRPYYFWPYYYSSFYFAPPGYAAGSGYSYSAPPSYDLNAPPGSYSAPAAPQFQREVVFPEGRYYLQGDGDAVPYKWVWVPNPPTAPPADAQGPR